MKKLPKISDEEIARRLAEILRGKAKGEPSDRVIAELREKYSRKLS